jgi:hypothetical protein
VSYDLPGYTDVSWSCRGVRARLILLDGAVLQVGSVGTITQLCMLIGTP